MTERCRSRIRRTARRAGALALAALLPAGGSAAEPDPIALIVHAESVIEQLSSTEALNLFLGHITTLRELSRDDASDAAEFEDARIRVYIHEPVEQSVLDTLLHMSAKRFRRRWVAALLSGRAAVGPETVSGPARVIIDRVVENTAAVGAIRLRDVPDTLKVVWIDGAAPPTDPDASRTKAE